MAGEASHDVSRDQFQEICSGRDRSGLHAATTPTASCNSNIKNANNTHINYVNVNYIHNVNNGINNHTAHLAIIAGWML